MAKKLRLKKDFYGNEGYGKRALYILDDNGQMTTDFYWNHENTVKYLEEKGFEVEVIE